MRISFAMRETASRTIVITPRAREASLRSESFILEIPHTRPVIIVIMPSTTTPPKAISGHISPIGIRSVKAITETASRTSVMTPSVMFA